MSDATKLIAEARYMATLAGVPADSVTFRLADALEASIAPESVEDRRQAVAEAVAKVLAGQEAMHCTRDWSAWSHGTMSADDFPLVSDDPDSVNEIADAAIAAIEKIEGEKK